MAPQTATAIGATFMNQQLRGELLLDEPMARHCSWRCGGSAKRYFVPADLADLQVFLAQLPVDEQVMWVGLGSNLLVRDAGFNGTVIATQGVFNQLELAAGNTVIAGAGVADAKLAKFCARNQLTGGEFFAGIPGLVGGALAMNAGAFGGETWRHVVSVETLDRAGQLHVRTPGEYEIAYRYVQLKNTLQEEWFVSATLRFEKLDTAVTSDVIDIKQLLAKRAATQPTGTASCGSVFRNPEGDFAARLIESCSLKGLRIGGAVVSEKHANFILNDDRASANDIEQLINHVQRVVFEKHGIKLRTEVRIVGEKE
jgi:UDP-N-acetylmuramate dehydrogenase